MGVVHVQFYEYAEATAGRTLGRKNGEANRAFRSCCEQTWAGWGADVGDQDIQ